MEQLLGFLFIIGFFCSPLMTVFYSLAYKTNLLYRQRYSLITYKLSSINFSLFAINLLVTIIYQGNILTFLVAFGLYFYIYKSCKNRIILDNLLKIENQTIPIKNSFDKTKDINKTKNNSLIFKEKILLNKSISYEECYDIMLSLEEYKKQLQTEKKFNYYYLLGFLKKYKNILNVKEMISLVLLLETEQIVMITGGSGKTAETAIKINTNSVQLGILAEVFYLYYVAGVEDEHWKLNLRSYLSSDDETKQLKQYEIKLLKDNSVKSVFFDITNYI